jgi:asparagine synthetase B (glutamine-hydrolysing)
MDERCHGPPRGPDASKTWVSAPDSRGWGGLLAHHRLSHPQPLARRCSNDRAVLVLNGEIYITSAICAGALVARPE